MTRARLVELQQDLEKAGWDIVNENKKDLFYIYDDKIQWHLINNKIKKERYLTFYLFNCLGQQTDNLADVHYVKDDNDSNLKLYFDKITSNDWKSNLRGFIRMLY